MLNMFRMLIHPSSGGCVLSVELFHGLYCSGTMCVGVTLWFGWGGVASGCRLRQCWLCVCIFALHIPHANVIFSAPYYIAVSSMSFSTTFFILSNKRHDFRKKKLNTQRVF